MIVSTKSRSLGKCLVCDSDATGINFGVSTCAPCKAFFRRNAVKLGRIDFICQQDGDCPITHSLRRMCSCCRLAKCFRVGMMRSLIRSEPEKEARKDLIQQNRQRRMEAETTNQLEWIRPSNLLYYTSDQTKYLSVYDQTLLTNILSIYERTCEVDQMTCQHFPLVEHSSAHSFFNEYKDRHMMVIEFFKHIPQFNRLSTDDKIRLIQNHFPTMFSINEPILNRGSPHTLVNSSKMLFHGDLVTDLIRCTNLMVSYTSDLPLLKLVLIVQSLSSGINRYHKGVGIDGIYDNTLAIFAGQTVYAELLWRYILSRSPSERDAVKFFNKLIQDLLFLQRTYFMANDFIFRLDDEIDQMAPLMQSMWPKQDRLEFNDDNVTDM